MYRELVQYCQALERRIAALEQRLAAQEDQADRLAEDIRALQQQKPVHIDIGNVTYKVQELAVRDLSGTLNIGLTALSDPATLEKWLSDAGTANGAPSADPAEPNAFRRENLSNSADEQG
jgi:uncharacterized coiled-coil protein SlyX